MVRTRLHGSQLWQLEWAGLTVDDLQSASHTIPLAPAKHSTQVCELAEDTVLQSPDRRVERRVLLGCRGEHRNPRSVRGLLRGLGTLYDGRGDGEQSECSEPEALRTLHDQLAQFLHRFLDGDRAWQLQEGCWSFLRRSVARTGREERLAGHEERHLKRCGRIGLLGQLGRCREAASELVRAQGDPTLLGRRHGWLHVPTSPSAPACVGWGSWAGSIVLFCGLIQEAVSGTGAAGEAISDEPKAKRDEETGVFESLGRWNSLPRRAPILPAVPSVHPAESVGTAGPHHSNNGISDSNLKRIRCQGLLEPHPSPRSQSDLERSVATSNRESSSQQVVRQAFELNLPRLL